MADTREIGKLLVIIGGVVLILAALIQFLIPWFTSLLDIPIVEWVNQIPGLVPFIVTLAAGIVAIYTWKTVKQDNTLMWGIVNAVLAIVVLVITLAVIVSIAGLGGIILLIGGVLLIVDAL